MGAYGSSRIITRQEACNLLGPGGTRRIEEGYSRLASLHAVSSNNLGGSGSSSIIPPIPGGGPRDGGGAAGSHNNAGPGPGGTVDRRTFQRFILDAFPVMVSQSVSQ